MKSTENGEKLLEFIRFCIVGVFATALHYGIYLLLMQIMNVNIAYTVGYLISFVCNFYLTAKFTFKSVANAKKGVGFAISHSINYCLHMILLNFFILIGMSKQLAPVPVYCIVIPVNFLIVRRVFKRR